MCTKRNCKYIFSILEAVAYFAGQRRADREKVMDVEKSKEK